KTAEARTIKSKDKGGKDTGKVRVESSATTTKAPPNLGTFKILIAITWLLFFACVVGIVYVLVEYKTERDALLNVSIFAYPVHKNASTSVCPD
ncbi:hypothetical protein GCK32_018522, partial [Trichostrongylus colubriformis]